MDKERIEEGPEKVVVQKWEESEKGWGTRPDGFSLHLSLGGLRRYVKEYWEGMPDEAPDEYSRPCGTPYIAGVSQNLVRRMITEDGNLRFYENYEYPGSGGFDGWVRARA
jgi:hypothetical protein